MTAQTRADYIDLSLASPRGSDFYPTTRFKHIMGRLLRQHPELTTDYPFPPGSERLRRQIAQRAVSWGCVLAAEDLVITNGCTEALQLALRACCKPGDTVGLESPTYFALLPTLKNLGLSVIEIPTHPANGLSLDALELLLSEKRLNAIVAMPTVHNPLGCTMPAEAKQRLAALVNEYQVPLIEDVPHADLHYDGATPDAVKAYDRDGWVLLCSSYSKTLAPGFRIGWIAPGRFLREVTRLKFASSLAQPRLLEETLAEYLETGGYDHHLRLIRRHFMSQMERLRGTVASCFRRRRAPLRRPAVACCGWNCPAAWTPWSCSRPRWPNASPWRPARCTRPRAATATACGCPAAIRGTRRTNALAARWGIGGRDGRLNQAGRPLPRGCAHRGARGRWGRRRRRRRSVLRRRCRRRGLGGQRAARLAASRLARELGVAGLTGR